MRVDEPSRDSLFPPVDMGDFIKGSWTKITRNWFVLCVIILFSLVGSIYYVLTATPLYTANGAIIIDPRDGQVSNLSGSGNVGLASLDALVVDSELRILGSREITTKTMLELDFINGRADQNGTDSSATLRQKLEGILGIDQTQLDTFNSEDASPMREARGLEALRREFVQGLRISRSGESYVVDITYTSPDVVFAAEAVNALINEYLRASGEQKISQVQQTRAWLSERIEALEISVREAETAVAEFRSQNDGLGLQNELSPTEIALSKGVEDLITLRGQAMMLDVQVQRVSEQISDEVIERIQIPVNERTPALVEFQSGYAELLREEQGLLANWSEDSPLVVAVREQKAQLRHLILGEYQLIRDRLASRRDIMREQAQATEIVMNELREEYSSNIQQAVQLRNLEREAEAERHLYDQLLEEFVSSSQLVTFESDIARVIAWAVPPDKKSFPQSRKTVMLSVFGAMFLGVSLIVFLELLDGRFRTYDQIESELGLPAIGIIPQFQTEGRKARKRSSGRASPIDGKLWRQLSKSARRLFFTVKFPYSISAEAVRNLQSQLDAKTGTSGASPVIGFVSTARDEGKTTTAFNFAGSLAQQKKRVVVLDMDLRTQNLTGLMGKALPEGNDLSTMLEADEASVANLRFTEGLSQLVVVGNIKNLDVNINVANDFDRVQKFIEDLRRQFDVVILDLPAVQGVSEVRQLAGLCDHLVYLVRWGYTARVKVRSVFKRGILPREKVLGVLYSRVPLKKFKSFNPDGLNEHYY